MKEINKVKVSYNGKVVGSIIRYQRYLTAFAYDPEWLSNGFSISPFSLPLREEPFIAKSLLMVCLAFLQTACLMDGADCCWIVCY